MIEIQSLTTVSAGLSNLFFQFVVSFLNFLEVNWLAFALEGCHYVFVIKQYMFLLFSVAIEIVCCDRTDESSVGKFDGNCEMVSTLDLACNHLHVIFLSGDQVDWM